MIRQIRSLSPAVLEQGLWSLAGFVASALVARLLGAEALAIFAIGTSIIFAVGVVVNSLILDPAGVIGPRDHDGHLKTYGGFVILSSAAFGALTFVTGLVVLVLSPGDWGEVVSVSLMSAFPVLMAWGARRLPYLSNQPLIALWGSFAYLVVVVGALLGASKLGILSPTSAIAILGLGAFAQLFLVLAIWKPRFRPIRERTEVTDVTQEHWRFGKWGLATEASSWIANYGLTAISAAVIDLTSAGAIRASQVLLRPYGILSTGIALALLPRLTRLQRDKGHLETRAGVQRMAWLLSGVASLAFIVFLVAGNQIMGLVFGPELAQYGWFVSVLSAGLIIHGWTAAYAMGLKAANRPRDVFVGHVSSAIASVVLGIPLMLVWGLAGAAVAPVLTATINYLVTRQRWNRVPSYDDHLIGQEHDAEQT